METLHFSEKNSDEQSLNCSLKQKPNKEGEKNTLLNAEYADLVFGS